MPYPSAGSDSKIGALQCGESILLSEHSHGTERLDVEALDDVGCLLVVVNGQVTASVYRYVVHVLKISCNTQQNTGEGEVILLS